VNLGMLGCLRESTHLLESWGSSDFPAELIERQIDRNRHAEGELPPMQFVGPDGEPLKVLNVRAESREVVVQLAARPVDWTPAPYPTEGTQDA
jgi:hypothetical protein